MKLYEVRWPSFYGTPNNSDRAKPIHPHTWSEKLFSQVQLLFSGPYTLKRTLSNLLTRANLKVQFDCTCLVRVVKVVAVMRTRY